jgi:hypothetical protein
MAILNSNGIVTFSSIPVTEPTTNGPTFGRLEDTNTFYYWDGSDWVTVILDRAIKYKALLSQTGVLAPTSSPAINTLGEVPASVYVGVGVYELGTVAALFTAKTIILTGLPSNTAIDKVEVEVTATNKISIFTYAAGVATNLEGDLFISIEVYP